MHEINVIQTLKRTKTAKKLTESKVESKTKLMAEKETMFGLKY